MELRHLATLSLLENLGVSESIGCLLGKLLLGVGKRPDVLPHKKSQDKINFAKVSSHTVLSYEAVLDAILYSLVLFIVQLVRYNTPLVRCDDRRKRSY